MTFHDKVKDAKKIIRKNNSVWRTITLRQKIKLISFILVLCVEVSGWTVLAIQISHYATETKAEYSFTMSEYEKARVLLQDINTDKINDASADKVKAEAPVVSPIKDEEKDVSSSPSSEIEEKILSKFGSDGKIALAIAKAESGLVSKKSNQMNRNGTYDWGIMQVNDCHCKVIGDDCHQKLLDPDFNINYAYEIYKNNKNTFVRWSTYQNKKYLAYL